MHCKSLIEILSQVLAKVKERKKATNKQTKEKKEVNKFDSSKYYSNKVMYTKKTCTYM